MIRILHVVSTLDIGAGMMSVVMNYYRHIDRTRVQFDFLYFTDRTVTHAEEIRSLGGRVFRIDRPTFGRAGQKRLHRFFSEHSGEFCAVHCHPIWTSSVIARQAKKSGIKHVIQHSHSTCYSDKRLSGIRNRMLMQFVGAYATDLIACNEEASYLFGKKAARSGKVFILHNAIELKKYAFDRRLRESIRDEFGLAGCTMAVGSVGRLAPQKNPLFIVDIFRALHDILPDSRLLMVGDGPLRSQVSERINMHGLQDYVTMTGERRDVRALLSGLDLFLLPSFFEGTPVSAIEARTSGLPCLLSDSITKSIDMTGVEYLSLDSSPLEWAKAAIALAVSRKDCDRSDCVELVRYGFDIEKESEKLQEYYLKMEPRDELSL